MRRALEVLAIVVADEETDGLKRALYTKPVFALRAADCVHTPNTL